MPTLHDRTTLQINARTLGAEKNIKQYKSTFQQVNRKITTNN